MRILKTGKKKPKKKGIKKIYPTSKGSFKIKTKKSYIIRKQDIDQPISYPDRHLKFL